MSDSQNLGAIDPVMNDESENLTSVTNSHEENVATTPTKQESEMSQIDHVQAQEYKGYVDAISKTQAVIEFEPDGTIVTANNNFLNALGYTLVEIQGKHHRMFVDSEYASSQEYQNFWEDLKVGKSFSGEFKRIDKSGNEIWIQASYNPILDASARPYKVVKFATDITETRKKAQEAARVQSSIEGSATAMMMVDRDFIITYANPATVKMVKENLSVFQTAFPGFDLEGLIGTCIDIFHKNPAHQRQLLADPNNLPYQATIQIGAMFFALNVSAMRDENGNYIGNTLEWSDVTEERKAAAASARVQSAIEGSATAMMMVDRDFIITYANPATVAMVKENLSTFKEAFPSFDLDKLIGTCIDIFHKKPEHQRTLLADPNNLPYQANIQIGHLYFALNVSAMRDENGNYIGNTLEWSNVTEQRRSETKLKNTIESVDNSADELNQATTSLSSLSTDMLQQIETITNDTSNVATGAQQMSDSMGSVSSAAEEASANINSVAVATEEMTSTISDIAGNAERARDVTSDAVENVQTASERVDELGRAAKEISMVIEAIVEIAEQTKLLALNATIEAARAGEAGKGFAVVANEVKELAKQTREATADIRTKIENIQTSTEATVGEIGNINSVINQVNEIVNSIATAVEEQNVTTRDIAQNIGQATSGVKSVAQSISEAATVSQEIADNINRVSESTDNVKVSAENVNQQSDGVSRTSKELKNLVDTLRQ